MRFTVTMVIACGLAVGTQGEPRAQSRRTVRDGVYTAAQADRGKRLYEIHCASCHGPDLLGHLEPPEVPVRAGMPTHTPALVGREFSEDYQGLAIGLLQERIRSSMPRGNPGILTRKINADITAYILNANGYPAGTTELPDVKQLLDEIQIVRQLDFVRSGKGGRFRRADVTKSNEYSVRSAAFVNSVSSLFAMDHLFCLGRWNDVGECDFVIAASRTAGNDRTSEPFGGARFRRAGNRIAGAEIPAASETISGPAEITDRSPKIRFPARRSRVAVRRFRPDLGDPTKSNA